MNVKPSKHDSRSASLTECSAKEGRVKKYWKSRSEGVNHSENINEHLCNGTYINKRRAGQETNACIYLFVFAYLFPSPSFHSHLCTHSLRQQNFLQVCHMLYVENRMAYKIKQVPHICGSWSSTHKLHNFWFLPLPFVYW